MDLIHGSFASCFNDFWLLFSAVLHKRECGISFSLWCLSLRNYGKDGSETCWLPLKYTPIGPFWALSQLVTLVTILIRLYAWRDFSVEKPSVFYFFNQNWTMHSFCFRFYDFFPLVYDLSWYNHMSNHTNNACAYWNARNWKLWQTIKTQRSIQHLNTKKLGKGPRKGTFMCISRVSNIFLPWNLLHTCKQTEWANSAFQLMLNNMLKTEL